MLPPSRRLDPQGYYARLGVEPGRRKKRSPTRSAAWRWFCTRMFRRPATRRRSSPSARPMMCCRIRAGGGAYDEAAQAQPRPQLGRRNSRRRRPASTTTHGAHDFRPYVADAPWLDYDVADIGPGFTPKPSAASAERSRFPERGGPGRWRHSSRAVRRRRAGGAASSRAGAAPTAAIPPNAPPVAPQTEAAQRASLYGPQPVRLAGTPNYYVVPAAGPAILWRQEKDRDRLSQVEQLPPFSSVQAVRLNRQTGLVEVRIDDTINWLHRGSPSRTRRRGGRPPRLLQLQRRTDAV